MLNVAHAAVTRDLNGPGRRFTLWLQGCPRSCPGCFNPGLRPFEPRRPVEPGELAAEVLATAPLDGVSLSGGEPFAQARGLCALLDALRSRPEGAHLTALAFTGFAFEELRDAGEAERGLLERLDLLVDGPFVESLAAALPLRGSANQRLVALSPAGDALRREAERAPAASFGVEITAAAEILVTGFPPPEVLQALRKGVGAGLSARQAG